MNKYLCLKAIRIKLVPKNGIVSLDFLIQICEYISNQILFLRIVLRIMVIGVKIDFVLRDKCMDY